MKTAKEIRELLVEATRTGKYVYAEWLGAGPKEPPVRIIGARSLKGMTLARNIHGSEFMVSEHYKFFVQ